MVLVKTGSLSSHGASLAIAPFELSKTAFIPVFMAIRIRWTNTPDTANACYTICYARANLENKKPMNRKGKSLACNVLYGAPDRIRTCGLLLRRAF